MLDIINFIMGDLLFWAKVAAGVVLAAAAFAAWWLNKKWGKQGRIEAKWEVLPCFRIFFQEHKRENWAWRLVFKTFLGRYFKPHKIRPRLMLTNAKAILVIKHPNGFENTIGWIKGVSCDGASIPFFARAWLDRLWLMEAGFAHDMLYGSQHNRKVSDEVFYSLARRAHGALIARIAWLALRIFGWYPYWRAGRANPGLAAQRKKF